MKTATQEVISRKKVSSRTLEKSYFCIKCFYKRKNWSLKPWYHILKPLNPFSKTMVPYFSNRWTLFQKTMVPYFRTVELFSRTMVPYYHILKPLTCFWEPWYHILKPLNYFDQVIRKPLNCFWESRKRWTLFSLIENCDHILSSLGFLGCSNLKGKMPTRTQKVVFFRLRR